jgi:hypothetical protein
MVHYPLGVVFHEQIGRRIRIEILQEKRADYGKEILATLSRELTNEYGIGFKEASLWRLRQD